MKLPAKPCVIKSIFIGMMFAFILVYTRRQSEVVYWKAYAEGMTKAICSLSADAELCK